MGHNREEPLRCVEFFAGLGGYSCALRQASLDRDRDRDRDSLPPVQVVAAYEVDQVCCNVFEHNHGLRPSNKSIETLDAAALSAHCADLWVLSPPCQPFTRGGACRLSARKHVFTATILVDGERCRLL